MRTFEIIRAADHSVMPWKNGGGETSEIAAFPVGSTLDDFDWRLSMARVASSGPFSSFPGVDRTLVVVDGAGFELDVAGNSPVTLTPHSTPYAFAADAKTTCKLIEGEVVDLNIMTRRAKIRHGVRQILIDRATTIRPSEALSLIFCARGAPAFSIDGVSAILGTRDTLVVRGRSSVDCEPAGVARLIMVDIAAHP